MSTTTWSEDKVITIKFPKRKFESYLKKVGHSDNKPLFPHFSRLVFGLAYEDFIKGKLSLDDFSEIAERLWSHEGDRNDELSDKLLLAAELNFYVRSIEKDNFGLFSSFMAEVCE